MVVRPSTVNTHWSPAAVMKLVAVALRHVIRCPFLFCKKAEGILQQDEGQVVQNIHAITPVLSN